MGVINEYLHNCFANKARPHNKITIKSANLLNRTNPERDHPYPHLFQDRRDRVLGLDMEQEAWMTGMTSGGRLRSSWKSKAIKSANQIYDYPDEIMSHSTTNTILCFQECNG